MKTFTYTYRLNLYYDKPHTVLWFTKLPLDLSIGMCTKILYFCHNISQYTNIVTFLFSLRPNTNVVETSSFSLAMCHNKVPNSKEYVYKPKTQTDS